ncbi:tubulin-like doman-containing protein [Rhizohabitans arisaemae]|uniref:tubulin-like doman-containing protein n=1 Tax=Rhizohabitans arisaemae TaxID=2720610 RepID=UPI0024B1B4FF|nr:tubulin-like doman-containing protein [Rhizohabitans arisaemae]
MKIYQPVLFIGLGGTGCLIGAELERRLREEWCGPDGTAFAKLRPQAGLLPYQLPSCVQFVYADVNQADLDQLPARVVPGPRHVPAVHQTAHYVRDLVPQVDTYPEVARNLRLSMDPYVEGWLPPVDGEPRVAPLSRGAGQLPTVGRAALFETFREGLAPALRDLRRAIGNLSKSGEDLYALSGKSSKSVDVFVAFSVAGGTGAGIFYDYLHLIGKLFGDSELGAKIFPLVLMPSAFTEGMGGGRPAELNAGRSLLDLFRLVDQQNGGDANRDLRGYERRDRIDPDDVAVHYPTEGRIVMRPTTVQTGFLFSRPLEAEREDLHRSVVSLMLSLISTELDEEDRSGAGELHQSFADSFINASVDRQVIADNGIGNRGVSTALVASLTVPVDELADLVAGRLLRAAVEEMATPLGDLEENRALIGGFLTASGIESLLNRQGVAPAEPEPVKGARQISIALGERAEGMRAALRGLDARLAQDVPKMVADFEPRAGVLEVLAEADVFRTQRVIFGYRGLASELDQIGAHGLMQRRRAGPPAPQGLGAGVPVAPPMRDRMAGTVKVKWSDPVVVSAREAQNAWYQWQTHVLWSKHWAAHTPRWRRVMEQLDAGMRALTRELIEYARTDAERFGKRAGDLLRPRVGVSYLLPLGGNDVDQFYRRVIRQMVEHRVSLGQMRPNTTEAELLGAIIGVQGWREAYRTSQDENPATAVAVLREQVKREVKTFFRLTEQGRHPLIPRLDELLANAAGYGTDTVTSGELEEFRGKLAGLVPAGFTPQGSGQMKVLISYPAAGRHPSIEAYLREALRLPTGPGLTYQFKPTAAESIAVVLFRTSMGVTEVREVRDVLRLWSDALSNEEPQDHLRWRQRTGYDFGYLVTREEHRVEILHRLLCAMWNGRVGVEGDPVSPRRIRVVLGGGVTMTLSLTAMASASSWGSLLRAYELWTLADNEDIRRRFCGQLMRERPAGLDSVPDHPDELYLVIRDLAEGQVERINAILKDPKTANRARAEQFLGFWARTLPSSLDLRFRGLESPVSTNLRALEIAVPGWRTGGETGP